MKLNKLFYFLLAFTIVLAGCNDDDDSTPSQSLENAELSFSASDTPIELPAAMLASDDPNAQLAVGYVQQINGLSTQLSLFEVPAGATKSTTPIGKKGAENGRTEEDYLVYTFTDGDYSVAYQISETTTHYVFELFWKFTPESDYVKIVKAQESKLIREGFLEYYTGQAESEFVFRYEWFEDPDGVLYFDLLTSDDEFRINAIINPNNSGTIDYYINGVIFYEISWNADGSGSWRSYDFEGNLSETGEWTV
ncbi:hypothetical protein [Fulvivirga lutea]|uniref:Lipoprotein n=1 Tax=Fulvivirga lutea TaxID=2810512 RepID=A0A974WGD2_9BACT|nr:hypothetical protein [Fulvivirga lutea]QSE96572.1 hypothetical protein JR347_13315 [Fulvivirga lutea]